MIDLFSQDEIRGRGMTSQRTRDRLVQRLRDKGIRNESVLNAISSVPRHLFVDEALATRSYEDTSLPIAAGQTISQPYIVAKMTELLLAEGIPNKVLELGTGSGYQASVLSRLVPELYTVERIKQLLNEAIHRFIKLKYENIKPFYSDGGWGLENYAPFDAIMLTAAPREIPDTLYQQLAVGGIMVAPVGAKDGKQSLLLVRRTSTGFTEEHLSSVSFVPFLEGCQ
jgi:protein-L-isoaspartate(D-aspartate) O-methyltransferase